MRLRIFVAIAAMAGLAFVDYWIVAAAFLYRPSIGEWLLALVLVVFVLGVALRRSWLIHASQVIVWLPLPVRLAMSGDRIHPAEVAAVAGAALAVALLSWIVARAWSSSRTDD